MVNRDVVGAHYGLRDWLAQRVTAVVTLDYDNWQALWRMQIMRYATVFFLVSLLYHAWVGVRNILMDYVKDLGVRLVLYVLVILTLIGYGVWTLQILWGR